ELVSVLGRGPSGTVYRAVDRRRTHLSETARCVAVKVLNITPAARPSELAEFERAFHQAQSLAHPNILSVFDLDCDEGAYFIVMELLAGRLLSSVLQDLNGRPMRRKHAFGVIGGIGAALAHAHRREIVHGDLKPASVMLTNSGEVRVLDFGFARHRILQLHTASTSHEASAPTPAYASVERVNGSEPDPSDDVYSIACIAYELLTGGHPFGGRSAWLARARRRRPPRVRGLNHKQQQALQRALLWTRGERRMDIAELLSALGCAQRFGPDAPPEEILAPPERRWRWVRAAAWIVFILALIAAASVYVWPRINTLQQQIQKRTAATSFPARGQSSVSTALVAKTTTELSTAPDATERPEPLSASQAAEESGARKNHVAPEHRQAQAAAAGPPALIEFDKDTYVAKERDGVARVLIRQTGAARGAVGFRWSLRGNSAQPGQDFAAIGPGYEELPAGATTKDLTIPLVSDTVAENTELFLVELQPAPGASLGERSRAAVIVIDDD
ncbi:MAG TPA: protein kinase, partial [Steroidobacter sp.]|nr:protein kinase [Steroidobacter sp.]